MSISVMSISLVGKGNNFVDHINEIVCVEGAGNYSSMSAVVDCCGCRPHKRGADRVGHRGGVLPGRVCADISPVGEGTVLINVGTVVHEGYLI